MKKIFMFSVSFFTSLCLFSGVMLGVVILGGIEKKPKSSPNEELPANEINLPLLVAFFDGDRLFATYLELNPKNNICNATKVDCTKVKNRPDQNGIYPFTGECFETLNVPKSAFIFLNESTFSKAVDRAKTVTYTMSGTEYLLTSAEATETLCEDSFTEICQSLAEKSMQTGLESELLYFADLCENTLSMPKLLKKYNP
jgi:hypothetical protein